jgi:membrane peptidoglycan carboxypeptidase
VNTPDFTGSGRPRRRESGPVGRARGDRLRGDVYGGGDGHPRGNGRGRGDRRTAAGSDRGDGYSRGDDRERYGLRDSAGRGDGYGHRDSSGRGEGYGRRDSSGRGEGYGRRDSSGRGDGYDRDDGGERGDGSRRGVAGRGGARPGGRRATRHSRAGDGAGGGAAGGSGNGGRNGGGRGGRPAKRKGSWWRHWTLKKAIAVFLGACGGVVAVGAILVGVAYASTPIPTDVSQLALQQSSTVYFSDGKTVVGTFGTTNRQVLTSTQIPAQLKNAVIAAEDRNFYSEGGISPNGILRAAFDDVTGSGDAALQGGSTITQQFVRNYYANIGSDQTISRKLKEIFVSVKLARQKSKDWILTQYLNTIYFGDGAYGVGAAAKTYFGKPAGELDVAQDAMIASMLNAPGQFDPTPGSAGYKPLVARWQYVLQGMVTMGKVTEQQASAQTFPKIISTRPTASGWTGYKGYIMQAVQYELKNTYHYTIPQIDTDGLHVVTTFSKPMMNSLYATVSDDEKLMAADGAPLPWYAHVGAVLEQPGTGAIVAMYSGPSYSEPARECRERDCNVDMALENREQVGSSFKPYVLATARAQGMNVKTSVLNGTSPLCVPDDIGSNRFVYSVAATGPGSAGCPTSPDGWYNLSNDAGDSGSGGPQSVVYSTAQSLNTAYADLAHRVGLQNVTDMAQQFGVNTGPYPQVGSGLQNMATKGEVGIALGQAALTVEEQANTFATLAADGEYVTPHVIKQITQGTTLISAKVTHREVLTPDEASDVDYALSFDTTEGTGTNAAMSDGRPIIGKTGTTNTAQSAFFLGAIPQYSLTVGMFTNNQNASTSVHAQTLNGVGGLAGYGGDWPAMIWHSFAEKQFAQLPIEDFPTADFGGTAWNLVGPGQGLTPKPHPTVTPQPTPDPSTSCTPDSPDGNCGTPPPTSPPPTSSSPTPTCTAGLRCRTGKPTPPADGGLATNGTGQAQAADRVRSLHPGGGG